MTLLSGTRSALERKMMVPRSAARRMPARRLPILAAASAVLLAATLAGCAQRPSSYEITGAVPDDYRTNHPILISEQVAAMDVPVSAGTAGLTPAIRSNITGFAQTFNNSGASLIAVVSPSGSPNQRAASRIAVEVEAVLRQAGVPPQAIDYRTYRAGSDEAIAPIRIAYARIDAYTKPCGPWDDQMSSNAQNRHYGSFGCASQQNLAAMVNNPLDLLYPRGLASADAERRASALSVYGQGAAGAANSGAAASGAAQ